MKKLISVLLVLAMTISMIVVPASAASAATATVNASLSQSDYPQAGEKFIVDVVLDDISSGLFLSGAFEFKWPTEVASLARYSSSTPRVATKTTQAIGNISDLYDADEDEGKYTKLITDIDDGNVEVALYIGPTVSDQAAIRTTSRHIFSVAFMLNEGQSYEDFYFTISNVITYLGEKGVGSSTTVNGDVSVVDVKTKEKLPYVNDTGAAQPGYTAGSEDDGVFELYKKITDRAVVKMTIETDNALDSLIAINNMDIMTEGNYYENSTAMMKIDGAKVKFRDGSTTITAGTLTSESTTVDVELEIDVANGVWSAVVTEDGSVVAERSNMQIRTSAEVLDCLVLWENTGVAECLTVTDIEISEPVYEVTFNANGGTCDTDSINVNYNDTYGTLPEPVRVGYDFAGWYKDGEPVSESDIVTSSHTLTAEWNIIVYTVKFDPDGGECDIESIDVEYGGSYDALPENITKVGHIFEGWYYYGVKVTASDIVTESHTLVALWSPEEYAIHFNTNGGGNLPVLYVLYGYPYGVLPEPIRAGYTFAGWYKDGVRVYAKDIVTDGHTLEAEWTINTYEVTFNANGGTCDTKTMDVTHGSPYGTLPVPTKYGYTFTGWYKDGVRVYETDVVTEIHTLVAGWVLNKYTVTLDANGGTCDVSSIVYEHYDNYGELPEPVREGYTFTGWYYNGVRVLENDLITAEHTLVAEWTIKSHEVIFDANGGTCSLSSMNVTHGSAYNTLPNPYREGYTFIGWYKDGVKVDTTVKVTSAHTLVAVWEIEEYTITFNPDGGVCDVESITRTYGEQMGTLPVPVREGYTFLGWYYYGTVKVTETDIVSGYWTLTAKWVINEYTVTFDPNGGECSVISADVLYGGQYTEFPTPTRTGYVFTGWYRDGVKVVESDIVTEAHTLVAGWEIEIYEIIFDANGGTCDTSAISVTYGDAYGTLPEASREGYTFNGWYKNGVKVSGTDVVAEAHTLTAGWTINTYTITFNANGGECGINSMKLAYGSELGQLPVATKEGHNFVGWSDGASVVTSTTTVKGSCTLVAVWEVKVYTVSVMTNDDEATIHDIQVEYGQVFDISAVPVPEKWCYVFNGWYLEDEFGEQVDGELVVKSDITIVAAWEVISNRIEVGMVSGFKGKTVTLPISIAENPGIAGFTFTVYYGEGVTPISVNKGSLLTGGTLMTNMNNSGYFTVTWSNPSDITGDGDLLLVTFEIAGDAEDNINVDVWFDKGDVTNQLYENVPLVIGNGGVIEAIEVIKGDVYEDKEVNTKDTVRFDQYLADWDITLSEYETLAADVYADNIINMRDRLKLGKYLVGLETSLMSVTDETGAITFDIGKLIGEVDGYVDIPVSITENDGVSAFKVLLNYDKSLLTPVSIVQGDILGDTSITSNIQQSTDMSAFDYVSVVWSNIESSINATGIAFTVRFKVNKSAVEFIPVTMTYEDGNILDAYYEQLNVTVSDGGVFLNETAEYLIEDYVVKTDSVETVVNFVIRKIAQRDTKPVLVIAVYDDGCMVDIITEEIDLITGVGEKKVHNFDYGNADEVKAFVIEDFKTIKSVITK